jgi:acylphosphatase
VKAVRLIISGKVQGVFYRVSAREKALALGIGGWIKNLNNGNVEAVVCGEAAHLNEFVEWCKAGPAGAKVTDVFIEPASTNSFTTFKIK